MIRITPPRIRGIIRTWKGVEVWEVEKRPKR
jgi:hypothetical protein